MLCVQASRREKFTVAQAPTARPRATPTYIPSELACNGYRNKAVTSRVRVCDDGEIDKNDR